MVSYFEWLVPDRVRVFTGDIEMKKIIILMLCMCNSVLAATHYVDLNNPSPTPPYTSWARAAHNIQDAVDEAIAGETVLVADGTYFLSSQITVAENITIQSVNGREDAIVDGNGTNRCFNLGGTESQLIGFTISNGYTRGFWDRPVNMGGGVYCSNSKPMIRDCYLTKNHSGFGGGALLTERPQTACSSATLREDTVAVLSMRARQ